MNSIIFDGHGDTVTSLYQWDANRIVRITGLIPHDGAIVFFHFSNRKHNNALVVLAELHTTDSTTGVKTYQAHIPNVLLSEPDAIFVYVYEKIGESNPECLTSEAIRIPLVPRERPDDYVYQPTDVVVVPTGLVCIDGMIYLTNGETTIGNGVPIGGGAGESGRVIALTYGFVSTTSGEAETEET